MVRRRLARTAARVRAELRAAFLEDHTPQEVAISFTIGVFITALPTLGVGFAVFVLLAYFFRQLSKIALFASVIVLNPPVKWGVYTSSFWLGNQLLGPIPGVTLESISLSLGPAILARLWLGNLILAVVFAAIAYVVALRLVTTFHAAYEDDQGAVSRVRLSASATV